MRVTRLLRLQLRALQSLAFQVISENSLSENPKVQLEMVKTLRDAEILEWTYDEEGRRRAVVNADLGEDFSIHHALSLYLLHVLPVLEKTSETYALDVLTFVESILEDPEPILRRQLDKLKGEKVAELKKSETRYRAIVENASDPIVITDLEGRLRLGHRQLPDGGWEILRVDGERLVRIAACGPDEECVPIRFHRDGGRVYLETSRGESDLSRLVLLDPATGAEVEVERDPEG